MKLELTLSELLEATGGKLILRNETLPSIHIQTDTRKLRPGDFFLPIKGPTFDGHDFLHEAGSLGAAGAFCEAGKLTSLDLEKVPPTLIEVKDSLRSYQQAASALRKKWKGRVIAVTGSSGKTSVKEMIAAVLAQSYSTLRTEINENNEIGVPKTLLNLTSGHEAAVIEMGMRGQGQIRELAEIACPDIAVITNIGLAHVEKLGSPREIMEAKKEIFSLLPISGKAIYPGESPWAEILTRELHVSQLVPFGLEDSNAIRANELEIDRTGIRFLLQVGSKNIAISLRLMGRHHLYNALAAAAAAYSFGASLNDIKNGLESYRPLEGRGSQIRLKRQINLIDDSYNANPDSMEAGLRAFSLVPGCKIVLLGDMLELGEYAEEAHQKIGELAASLRFDKILTVGNYRNIILKGAETMGFPRNEIFAFESNGEALEYLIRVLKENDSLFIKASHGQHLEEVANELIIRLS